MLGAADIADNLLREIADDLFRVDGLDIAASAANSGGAVHEDLNTAEAFGCAVNEALYRPVIRRVAGEADHLAS